MKKIIAFIFTLTLALSMATFVAIAGNGNYRVTTAGNGSNARIVVNGVCTGVRVVNNSTIRVTAASGTQIDVVIQGNSVRTFNVVTEAFAETPSINAGTGNAPNHSSGGQGVQRINNVEIRGNGSSARIWVDNVNTTVRPANNTWTTIELADSTIEVFVRGNAILEVRTVAAAVELPDVPYVVETYSFYQFVELNQVESYFTGTSEVAGSRELVGLTVSSTFVEVNFSHIPDSPATGMGVLAGFTAAGTLNYQFVRNYLEQFERVYEWVDVVVYSDGNRVEIVREDSEHVRGDLVDGYVYSSEPYDSSRAINVVSGNNLRLVRGHGQGYLRGAVTSGEFTVGLYLANQSPRIDVTSVAFDINAL